MHFTLLFLCRLSNVIIWNAQLCFLMQKLIQKPKTRMATLFYITLPVLGIMTS